MRLPSSRFIDSRPSAQSVSLLTGEASESEEHICTVHVWQHSDGQRWTIRSALRSQEHVDDSLFDVAVYPHPDSPSHPGDRNRKLAVAQRHRWADEELGRPFCVVQRVSRLGCDSGGRGINGDAKRFCSHGGHDSSPYVQVNTIKILDAYVYVKVFDVLSTNLGNMSDGTSLGRLLLDGYRWFDDALVARLNDQLDAAVTSAQSLLFAYLPIEGTTQSNLARRLGVTRQAINELVRGLERQGLVDVVPDPTSGRSKLVKPTQLGRRSIELALEAFVALETELRARIGSGAVTNLRRALAADWGEHP